MKLHHQYREESRTIKREGWTTRRVIVSVHRKDCERCAHERAVAQSRRIRK